MSLFPGSGNLTQDAAELLPTQNLVFLRVSYTSSDQTQRTAALSRVQADNVAFLFVIQLTGRKLERGPRYTLGFCRLQSVFWKQL